ncbi:unnamed protein product [Clonostachys byssicola]|uniref:Uncharacterized protein n=1 Tax=Clonostachys byssicola TaxID=160290 RepID=A0A9N9XTL3_9HYPO|nr:unnamed protein product [Clonostachys byssicola]
MSEKEVSAVPDNEKEVTIHPEKEAVSPESNDHASVTNEKVTASPVPKAPTAPVSGADAALELLKETGGILQPFDEAREKRLVRRIDRHIMPLICIVYFLQYIDKTSISYGSVTGLPEATGLVGNQFNWVASIFFFGQLAFEFPTIRLLQLFPLAKYVSLNVTLWGVTLACLSSCKNYAGLLACRFFLGAFEAAIIPAWVLFTSQWYNKSEQAFRVGIWFSVCGTAQMFGGFFAYGVATHVGSDPNALLDGWQVIFLFLGLLTVVVGIAFYFLIPDSPATAKFLSTEEKGAHLHRIRGNEQGIGSPTFKLTQVREALTDPMTWLYCFWVFAANIPNSTATSFGIPIGWTTILGMKSSNVAGSTKKVTVACLETIAYTVGNIISPQTFQPRDAPRYLPAKISICIIYFLCTVDLLVMRWVLSSRNKKRDQEKEAQGDAHIVQENHEFLDLTDLENKEFRYEL